MASARTALLVKPPQVGTPATPVGSDPSGVMVPGTTPSRLLDLPEGDSYLTNLPTLLQTTHLAAYHQAGQHAQRLTIAVLDNGFAGLNHSLGVRLPPDTKLVQGPAEQMQDTTHGVKLAEIVYAMATGQVAYSADVPGPRMLLVNTDGFSNLQAAVQTVIAEKADIVLYAQGLAVWRQFRRQRLYQCRGQ